VEINTYRTRRREMKKKTEAVEWIKYENVQKEEYGREG
jgi:hypothetical protein